MPGSLGSGWRTKLYACAHPQLPYLRCMHTTNAIILYQGTPCRGWVLLQFQMSTKRSTDLAKQGSALWPMLQIRQETTQLTACFQGRDIVQA